MEASPMRFLMLFAGAALFANGMVVRADDRKFPYEAIVEAEDGENVRSGPGPKYYPTDKLQKGDRVMVHRHDPGGWCMISPPPGSFSWIRAEHVQKSGKDSGVLKTNGVVVHIGSTIKPDEFTTVQANLSKSDAVEILGEKNFPFEDGPRLMYKISPVKREWRWIPRKSIVAVDAIRPDPFPSEQPPRKKRTGPVANAEDETFAQPISTGSSTHDGIVDATARSEKRTSENAGVRRTGPDPGQLAAGQTRLDEIDDHFRGMIRQEPPTWDLDSLETLYKELDEEIGVASMTSTIALRLDAVKRYRGIQKNYLEFSQLSSETKQRDAQLMALQSQPGTGQQTVPGPNAASMNGPQTAMATAQPPIQQPSAQRPPQTQASVPAFDGAGIVQKMARTFPGGPQFVLIAPDGRMLSFLTPSPGVDLNRHIGRSMGIIGQRVHRNDWNADSITVQSLQPVQLKGTR
jgi:hypothetical protein